MNMLSRVLVFGAFFAGVALADSSFTFDERLVKELATAYLQGNARSNGHIALDDVDWDKPMFASTIAKGGRHLVFVGFQSRHGSSGTTIIFEDCNDLFLMPADGGVFADVQEALRDFNSLSPGAATTIPETCHYTE